MRTTRLTAALIALAPLFAGCGDDGDAAGSFCDDLTLAQRRVRETTSGETGDLRALVDELRDVDAPAEVEGAFDDVVAAYAEIDESGSLADPAVATRLADADEAIAEIDRYIARHCGPTNAG